MSPIRNELCYSVEWKHCLCKRERIINLIICLFSTEYN